MKQFTLIAFDATDPDALNRRMAAREAHLASVVKHRANLIFGAAITDKDGKMVGSIISAQFPSREAFDAWHTTDPYIVQNVWEKVTVYDTKLAPPFADLLKAA